MDKMNWTYGLNIRNANGDVDPSTLGYSYATQTTTEIRKEIIKQKYFTVPIGDYIPVINGTGAWKEAIKTNQLFDVAGPFEAGVIGTASAPSELAEVNVGLNSINQKIITWAKGYTYSIPEVEKALAANDWDVVTSKMDALKRQWDLGIQKTGFLGLLTDLTGVPGLYTNPNVNINTTAITANINTFTPTQFGTLVAAIMGLYFTNTNSTELPDTLLVPQDDFLGLVTPLSTTYGTASMLTFLKQAFSEATGNANFRIMGMPYGSIARNAGFVSTSGKQRYVLYRNDPSVLRMDIPVPMNLFAPGTANNFQFEGVGAGQFSGVVIFRPAEVMYFDHT